jgi:hypothetical protein
LRASGQSSNHQTIPVGENFIVFGAGEYGIHALQIIAGGFVSSLYCKVSSDISNTTAISSSGYAGTVCFRRFLRARRLIAEIAVDSQLRV